MMKWLNVIALMIFPAVNSFAQALISDHIPNNQYPNEPPGLQYFDNRVHTGSYTFEIRFRLDPEKFSTDQQFACNGSYSVAEGYVLYDRYPTNSDGRWIVTIGGNGQLCYKDQPRYSWGSWSYPVQIPVEVGACHTLRAVRSEDGTLQVTLDDSITQTVQQYGDDNVATWESGSNGIGVGREINDYHEWRRWDSFPGEIYYVEDNGRIVDFNNANITGGAYLGSGVCDFGSPEPEPEPEPEPTACEVDPESVACACEVNPHPACQSCPME